MTASRKVQISKNLDPITPTVTLDDSLFLIITRGVKSLIWRIFSFAHYFGNVTRSVQDG
jgi:hypothetical protein